MNEQSGKARGRVLRPRTMIIAGVAVLALAGSAVVVTPAVADGTTLAGVVLEKGAGVEEVGVVAYLWDATESEYVFIDQAYTDEEGRWQLDGLEDGAYTLDFETEFSTARFALGESLEGNASYLDDDPTVIVAGGEAEGDFESRSLQRLGGAVTLSLTDPESADVLTSAEDAAAVLYGHTLAHEGAESAYTHADDQGEIAVWRLPEGTYIPAVSASGSELAGTTKIIDVTEGEIVEVGEVALTQTSGEDLVPLAGELALSGDAKVGSPLTASTPEFPVAPSTYRYTWFADGKKIGSATGATFTPTERQRGAVISATVVAAREGSLPYFASAEATGRVKGGPASDATVAISGTPALGRTLGAVISGSSVGGVTVEYRWYRDGGKIAGATKRNYTVTGKDVGAKLTVTARFTADDREPHTASSSAVRVAKDKASIRAKAPTRAKAGKSVSVTVTLRRGASKQKPTGTVKVRIGSVAVERTVSAGTSTSFTVRVPKVRAGKHKVKVSYSGSAQYVKSAAQSRVITVTKR